MEITTDSLEWTPDDIAHWNSFLNSRAGQRLIPKLLESVPPLREGGEINSVLIRSGEVRGWSEAVKSLLLLAREPEQPKTESPAYPLPEDDTFWNDQQSIADAIKSAPKPPVELEPTPPPTTH